VSLLGGWLSTLVAPDVIAILHGNFRRDGRTPHPRDRTGIRSVPKRNDDL